MKREHSLTRRTLHYFGGVTAKHMPMFLLAVFSTLGFIFFLSYGNPYLMGQIVDLVTAGPTPPDKVFEVFGGYMIALILCNLFGQVCSKLQDYSAWKLQIHASYELATYVFDTLSNQSMTFHVNRYGGSLVSQTNKFINSYGLLIQQFVFAIIPIAASAVFTLGLLLPIVPLYVAVLFCLLVVYLIVAYLMYKRILPLNEEASRAQNSLSGELSDSLTNILTVKTYGREAYERDLFDTANRDVYSADSRRMRASMVRGALTSGIIVVIMTCLVFFVAGGNAWFGISAGSLVMMFTYTYSMTMQFNRINLVFQNVNRALGDAQAMTQILDEPRLVSDAEGAKDLQVTEGRIDFEHLNFHYADASSDNKVFSDFSLHIPAGQRVGLVGKSGSGKTTLTSLLLRLSDVQEGRILIDGQDISQIKQVSLRRQIAYVPQEPMLFHRTIKENIAYGRPEASDEEIIKAAREANAWEFIQKLPQGIETQTGERGVKLSGGQRQRIAIARALLADAPILVLDEATSALDSESEHLVQEALSRLMKNRTCIVVAHRLSTVAGLDRIVVLSHGKIVEDGKHADLIKEDGEYAHLWDQQTGAFLDDGQAWEAPSYYGKRVAHV
jgi:ATP-binding cassette subfamily B protein